MCQFVNASLVSKWMTLSSPGVGVHSYDMKECMVVTAMFVGMCCDALQGYFSLLFLMFSFILSGFSKIYKMWKMGLDCKKTKSNIP